VRGCLQPSAIWSFDFKLTIDQLKQLAAPVIVFVQPLSHKHFAVLRRFGRARVFLADPAGGNLRMSIECFVSEWDGIVFVPTRGPQYSSPHGPELRALRQLARQYPATLYMRVHLD
jgi:ABC-type bacteriocin/lantibiotic exporter with double-glycine peptidase domain